MNFIDPQFGNYTVAALKIIYPNIHDTFQLIYMQTDEQIFKRQMLLQKTSEVLGPISAILAMEFRRSPGYHTSRIKKLGTNKHLCYATLNRAHLFSQTPTLLLTPSPLLSNIHFWSTLSPVAPLSPATRRQGGHLFQVSITNYASLYIYSHLMCLNCLHCLTLPSPLVPVCTHVSVPDPRSQHGWDQHTWPDFSRPSENIGQQRFFFFHFSSHWCFKVKCPQNRHYD